MTDLKSKRLIYLKAFLFVIMGAVSGLLLLAPIFNLQNTLLLALVIWSFCRAYYFAFYVIEHYVDPGYRFAGLISAGKYFLQRRRALD